VLSADKRLAGFVNPVSAGIEVANKQERYVTQILRAREDGFPKASLRSSGWRHRTGNRTQDVQYSDGDSIRREVDI
jgi:hypothetical protein